MSTRNWQTETAPYIPKLKELLERLKFVKNPYPEKFVSPFAQELSAEQRLAISLIYFSRTGVLVIEQLLGSVLLLWSKGRMIGVASLVRSSLEYWAAIHFANHIFGRYEKDKNIDLITEQYLRLTGARTPVKLPWGGETSTESYSVMKFVEMLDKSYSGILSAYATLSEGTHPNYHQNFYFYMASKAGDNFSNDSFRTHAHSILTQIVDTTEVIVDGLAKDHQMIMERGNRLSKL